LDNIINRFFEDITQKNILIIGDSMLDAYIWGDVKRISPEAPVPVVLVKNREYRLGGAANVAMNIVKLGATPKFISVIGEDAEGKIFSKLLQENGIQNDFLIYSSDRPTIVKTRIIGNQLQQLLRIDEENTSFLPQQIQYIFIEKVKKLIPECHAVIFSDYDKGILNKENITEIVDECIKHNVPSIVDPKRKNFLHYHHTSLFKPNLKELQEGLGFDFSKPITIEQLRKAANALFDKMNIDTAFFTMSDEGVYINNRKKDFVLPSHKRNIYDVSGAGDTVASVAALAFSCGLDIDLIAELSNIAGGLVCEKVGVVPVERNEFRAECSKIFFSV